MKKRLIVLLAAVLALQPIFAGIDGKAAFISISAAAGEEMPVGTKTEVGLMFSGSAARLDVLSSYDGENYSVVGSFEHEADVDVTAEYEEYEKLLKAEAYDADGNLVAESEPIKLVGMKENIVREVWDESFDSAQTIPDSGNSNVLYIARNGARVTNADGNFLQGAVWSGGSVEIIPYSENEDERGDSVCMRSSSSSNTQFNALWSKATGDIAVFELDYLFENPSVNRPLMEFKAIQNGNETWLPATVRLENGRISFGGALMSVEADKWYTITAIMDSESGEMKVLVNGEYLGRSNVGSFSQTVRLSLEGGAADSVMWIDNYRVRQVKYTKAAEKLFGITRENEGGKIYIGESCGIKIVTNGYKDAENVEILTSEDGESFEHAATVSAADSSADITVNSEKLFVRANLLSQNGDILAGSETLELSAKKLIELESVWNVDFETNGFRVRDGGGTRGMVSQVVTKADGDDLRDKNDGLLECDRGALENVMKIDSLTVGEEASKGIRMTSVNGSAENQLSRWPAAVDKNISLVGIDACVINEAATTRLMQLQLTAESGTPEIASVEVRSGRIVFTDDSGSVVSDCAFETGKWYSIKLYTDLAERTVRLCVNDKCIGQFTAPESMGKLVKTNKISAVIAGTDGAEIYFDNYIVSRVWEKTAIVSAEADSESGGKAVNIKLDSAITPDMADMIKSAKLICAGRELVITDCRPSEDGKTLTLVSPNKIPTAVGIKCTIELTTGDAVSTDIMLAEEAFDITNVTFGKSGGKITASAKIVNKTGEDRHVIMLMTLYNADGEICGTSVSEADVPHGSINAQMNITGGTDAASARVFFINNLLEGAPLKGIYYDSIQKKGGAA